MIQCEAKILENGIEIFNSYIPFKLFKFLTGKNYNFSIRLNHYVNIIRENGHIYLRDKIFILNQKYTFENLCYMCTHIDYKKEEALLTSIDDILEVVCLPLKKAKDWNVK
jgi:hypothetical protein